MDETKKYYRSHGICVDCGRHDAAPGKITCEVCAAKRTERENKRYHDMSAERKSEYLKKHAESCKNRYYQRKKEGLCVRCGSLQAKDSTRLCISCRAKEKGRKKGILRRELPSYGICYLCCKEPILEGKGLCAKCYEKSLRSMEIARRSDNGEKAREYFRNLEHLDFMERTKKGREK